MPKKSRKPPLQVTSFRLPPEVKDFLAKKADEQQRTMSFVLVEYIRYWINWEAEQAKQPKVKK